VRKVDIKREKEVEKMNDGGRMHCRERIVMWMSFRFFLACKTNMTVWEVCHTLFSYAAMESLLVPLSRWQHHAMILFFCWIIKCYTNC